MAVSNHRPRISLQFNDFDFRHRKVLEILRARPRNMTDMVVNAILHFISCPDAEQEYNKESLKKIIREVILEMQAEGNLGVCSQSTEPDEPAADPDLSDMMAAFRNQA